MILFAAYGVTLRSDFVDKSYEFRKVIALSGFAVAVVAQRILLRSIRQRASLAWATGRKIAPVGRQYSKHLLYAGA
jgi:hypothetical protein